MASGIPVQDVDYDGFSIPPLTTASGNVVSRRRVQFPPQQHGPYSDPNSGGLNIAEFRLYDQECFIDLYNLRLTGTFYGNFTPVKTGGGNRGPDLDQSIQALIRHIQVGTVQALQIDEINYYNLLCNIIEAHSETASAKRYDAMGMSKSEWYNDTADPACEALDNGGRMNVMKSLTEPFVIQDPSLNVPGTTPTPSVLTPVKVIDPTITGVDIVIALKQVALFNRVRFLPLFLLRYGLRLLLTFEDPRIAFYNNVPASPITRTTSMTASAAANIWQCTSKQGGAVQSLNFASLTNVTSVRGLMDLFANCVPLVTRFKMVITTRNSSHWVCATFVSYENDNDNGFTVDYTNDNIMNNIPIGTPYATPITTGATFPAASIGEILTVTVQLLDACATARTNSNLFSTNAVQPSWKYTLENLNIIGDLIRPASKVHDSYFKLFESPQGIIYPYVSTQYVDIQIPGNFTGEYRWVLPVSKRSVKGVLLVITDPLSFSTGSDNTIYNFPSLSSFQMGGLESAYLEIGSQRFPQYVMRFRSVLQTSHLPEIQALYNVAGIPNYLPSYSPGKLDRFSRTYGAACGFNSQLTSTFQGATDIMGVATETSQIGLQKNTFLYQDTSRFILGISTMKLDGDFLSGVDTTQSGSMVLNMNFIQPDAINNYFPARPHSRARFLRCFVLYDAALQIQSNKVLVSA